MFESREGRIFVSSIMIENKGYLKCIYDEKGDFGCQDIGNYSFDRAYTYGA